MNAGAIEGTAVPLRPIDLEVAVALRAGRRVMEKAGLALCDTRLAEVDGELVEVAVHRLE